MKLVCPACGRHFRPQKNRYTCDCGSVLTVEYGKREWKPRGRGVWRYKNLMPFEGTPVTLNEGATALIQSERLDNELGLKHLYFKFEGDNPTDSFKDRGTTIVMSRAKKEGFKNVCTASTGNMGASVSAYAAHAGMTAKVFVPKDTPKEKLAQIIAYGARLERVSGSFFECVKAAREEAKHGSYLAITGLNPYYIEGYKSISFELFEDKGVPDIIVVPTGTGGLLTGIFKGFEELHGMRRTPLPKMVAVQAENCSPIIDAFEEGREDAEPVEKAKSIASAILVKTPFNARTALQAMKKSKGFGVQVSDKEIMKAIKDLGRDGIFAEPASAAALAALRKMSTARDDKIVLMITGHGLKDPLTFLR
ncbi:MAG: threonine synthase [Candidatus Diapherotrites archaeon]|nr:threonine synthase [Candidatus Diapherotrites archaeon]